MATEGRQRDEEVRKLRRIGENEEEGVVGEDRRKRRKNEKH